MIRESNREQRLLTDNSYATVYNRLPEKKVIKRSNHNRYPTIASITSQARAESSDKKETLVG